MSSQFKLMCVAMMLVGAAAGTVRGDSAEFESGPGAPLCCDCGESCWLPRWSISADALILDRVMNPTQIVGAFNGLSNIITGRSFDFLPATGPRIAGVYHWSPELAGEVNYFGIHGWHSEIGGVGGITFAGPSSIGAGPQRGGWEYGSRIDSAELNLRWSPRSAWTWIGGFRYVEWSETLHGMMSPPFNVYDYTCYASNQLYGGQLGLDWSAWNAGGPLRLDVITKAGAFSNRAASGRNGNSAVFASSETNSQTSFVGEVAAVGRWSISDTWALRGGYQLMWLSGIAVAPDQLNNSIFFPTDTSGGVLLHGATVGIEAQW